MVHCDVHEHDPGGIFCGGGLDGVVGVSGAPPPQYLKFCFPLGPMKNPDGDVQEFKTIHHGLLRELANDDPTNTAPGKEDARQRDVH